MNQLRLPIDTITTDELINVADRAWRMAARCWQDYRNHHRDPDDPDSGAVSQLLHDAAWSAEWSWRNLYDAVCEREELR